MTEINLLKALEEWYAAQVNGDWEHTFGVEISTLDNPGWSVAIDLRSTELENQPMIKVRIERTETDWFECRVESNVFRGFGGTCNLRDIVSVFLRWKASQPGS
ncbi:immunity 53 family protein [Longimicrobium sp.]|uniref:immunity 53 family protein n=1 Tax=Longimicrobium sp. TaxID=2029185 RepID=UPI0032C238F5